MTDEQIVELTGCNPEWLNKKQRRILSRLHLQDRATAARQINEICLAAWGNREKVPAARIATQGRQSPRISLRYCGEGEFSLPHRPECLLDTVTIVYHQKARLYHLIPRKEGGRYPRQRWFNSHEELTARLS